MKMVAYHFDTRPLLMLLGLFFKKPAVIHIRCVERGGGIMGENAVLGDNAGAQSIGVLDKQTVMTDTKSHYKVKVGVCVVEKLCLQNGVAHINADFLAFGRNANVDLGCCSAFTDNSVNLKTVVAEDFSEGARFLYETEAGCNADFGCTDFAGKLDYLFNAGTFAVSFVLDLSRGNCDAVVFGAHQLIHSALVGVGIYIGCKTEFGISAVLIMTVISVTVKAGKVRRMFFFHGDSSRGVLRAG